MAEGIGGIFFGEWKAVLSTLKNAPRDFKNAKRVALLQEAEFYRTQLVRGIRSQAPGGKTFVPLSPTTIALRKFFGFRGTKALVRRSDLVNAITVHELHDAEDSVFVGVQRNAKNEKGESLVDIAKLNEYGSKPIVIKITPKMAALLHMAFRKANLLGPLRPSTGVITVQIPARPFMGPVFEKFAEPTEASKRFAERFQKAMAGKGVWSAVKETI